MPVHVLNLLDVKTTAYLEGANLPKDFPLPPLDVVTKEATTLDTMRRKDGKPGLECPSEPLKWHTLFPNLFKFAYFVRVQDVTMNLLKGVILALKMLDQIVQECSVAQLHDLGYQIPGQSDEDLKRFMLSSLRRKLGRHVINPWIDRPADGIPYLQAAVAQDTAICQAAAEDKLPWVENPLLFWLYSEALSLSGAFNEHTKSMLEKTLEGAAARRQDPSFADLTVEVLRTRIHLSQVLLRMGVEPDVQKEHTEWAAKFLRKKPSIIPKFELKQILKRTDQPPHPVLVALGGPKWLEDLGDMTARQAESLSKVCRTCGGREPQKTLSRCSRCQHIYYCSKECQKQNWKFHKESCRELAELKGRAKELKRVNPDAARCASDWSKWCTAPNVSLTFASASALGLHRDPSRSRTHIIFLQVKYNPSESRDISDKFRIIGCGVYRISDILPELEGLMNLDKGEGKEYIRDVLEDLDAADHPDRRVQVPRLPMLSLGFGTEVSAWLGSMAIGTDDLRMRVPYNPKWRDTLNSGDADPPVQLTLRSGVKDVENVF